MFKLFITALLSLFFAGPVWAADCYYWNSDQSVHANTPQTICHFIAFNSWLAEMFTFTSYSYTPDSGDGYGTCTLYGPDDYQTEGYIFNNCDNVPPESQLLPDLNQSSETGIQAILNAVNFDGVFAAFLTGALAVIGVFLMFVGIRVAKRLASTLAGGSGSGAIQPTRAQARRWARVAAQGRAKRASTRLNI